LRREFDVADVSFRPEGKPGAGENEGDQLTKVACTAVCVAALCGVVGSAQEPSAPRLLVKETNGAYELSLAVSRLVLTIPKGQLVRSGQGSASPTYFSFEDHDSGLVISGWFEPEQAFAGMDEFWNGEQQGLTQNGFRMQNVVLGQVGGWQTVFYDIVIPRGRSSNVRAELVQAGTWIDVHASLTTKRSEADNRQALRRVLEAIHVDERP
jgi:hypothetical protein